MGDDSSWASVSEPRGKGDEETLNNEISKVGGTRGGRCDTEDPHRQPAPTPTVHPPPPFQTRPILNSRSLSVAKNGRWEERGCCLLSSWHWDYNKEHILHFNISSDSSVVECRSICTEHIGSMPERGSFFSSCLFGTFGSSDSFLVGNWVGGVGKREGNWAGGDRKREAEK